MRGSVRVTMMTTVMLLLMMKMKKMKKWVSRTSLIREIMALHATDAEHPCNFHEIRQWMEEDMKILPFRPIRFVWFKHGLGKPFWPASRWQFSATDMNTYIAWIKNRSWALQIFLLAGVAGTLLWTFPEGAGPISITIMVPHAFVYGHYFGQVVQLCTVLDALSKGKNKRETKRNHMSHHFSTSTCV